MVKRLIMGRNCIAEVLKAHPDRLLHVYTCQKPDQDSLYAKIKKAGIPLDHTSKRKLSDMVSSESHQSYVALVHPSPDISIKTFLETSCTHSLVLMLDSIFDPQNLGAIMRAAECFGVDLLIYSKNRGTDITPTVAKSSVGASELIPVAKVSNLAETLKAFQGADYWTVAATAHPKAQNLYQFEFPEKAVIIMGSEGKGIQPLLEKRCDFHVQIPMHGQIDSLNVSQASALLLNAYRAFHSG